MFSSTSSTILFLTHAHVLYTQTQHDITLDTSTFVTIYYLRLYMPVVNISCRPQCERTRLKQRIQPYPILWRTPRKPAKTVTKGNGNTSCFILFLWTNPSYCHGNCSLGFLNRGCCFSAVCLIRSSIQCYIIHVCTCHQIMAIMIHNYFQHTVHNLSIIFYAWCQLVLSVWYLTQKTNFYYTLHA